MRADYMLMHRSTPVLELAADEGKALISRIGEVYRPEQAPTGTAVKDGRPDRQELFPWWSERSIPECRPGSREALDALGFPGPRFILNRSLGLSLSDQYLLNPVARPLNWEEVNFFDNPFSSDMGEALFGRIPEKGRLDLMSPDNATDGVLKKRWSVADGRRVLLKAGGFLQQEPFNEMIAAAVMRRLGIAHAPCSLAWDGFQALSACGDFVTRDTELVSAWRIFRTAKKSNSVSCYGHLTERCACLGISGAREAMDRMLAVDYLIANTDRHLNNFGALRNAGTLDWIGFAPVYDSGSSLWHDRETPEIHPGADQGSKPSGPGTASRSG